MAMHSDSVFLPSSSSIVQAQVARHRFLTEEEYQKEARDYTRQQLKDSGLYYRHQFHFAKLHLTQNLDGFWVTLLKITIAFLVLVGPIFLGLYFLDEGPLSEKKEVAMLPNPSPSENTFTTTETIASTIASLFQAKGVAVIPESNSTLFLGSRTSTAPVVGKKEETASKPQEARVAVEKTIEAKEVDSQEETQDSHQEEPVVAEESSKTPEPLTSYEPLSAFSVAQQGMNVFNLVYTSAVQFFLNAFGMK